MTHTHDLFISHSSATKELARHVFYNAVANSLSPWYDEALLSLGDQLEQELRFGIEASRSFVLFYCRAAIEKKWVPLEMDMAKAKYESDQSFRLIVVKLDNEPLPDFWNQFLFHSWNSEDQPSSILRLISELTGRNPVVQIASAAVLSAAPSEVFINSSNTIAEHSRNFVFYYLSHVKQLLSAVHQVGHEQELRDTLGKLLQLSVFEQLPCLQGGVIPIAPAIFEVIFPNRMRIAPRLSVTGLPSRYKWSIVKNSEISCRIAINESANGSLVQHPVPLSIAMSFDAEL